FCLTREHTDNRWLGPTKAVPHQRSPSTQESIPMRRSPLLIGAALLAAGFVAGGWWSALTAGPTAATRSGQRPVSPGQITDAERSTVELFQHASPSVAFLTPPALPPPPFPFHPPPLPPSPR